MREGARRAKSKHAEDGKKSGGFLKFLIFAIIFIIIVAISTFVWYNISLSGTGTSEEQVSFEIGLGSGTSKIADILKEKGVIRSTTAFKLYVKLNNISNFQAGNYTITKDMGVPEIANALQNGILFKDTGYNITFVEGRTFPYIAKTIASNTSNEEQDVYDVLKDEEYIDSLIEKYWFITDEIKNQNIYYALEGYLFPDTYTFEEKDIDVKDIFERMLDQMDKVLTKYKSDIQKSKHTVHEILSMAAIVENEAIFDRDRKDVASVLYNRIDANMSLGCDVTTYYAFKIELGSRDLNKSEINTYNPYNTRGPNMAGKIPVGPISSISKESIEAAIKPNNTNYLFFVADASRKCVLYKNK
ncbi:MAG: endolytic transglycosylase MltG [Clostridia bacterium]|jgi:UPF0755 protein|nr:endolytic transglycosylase MltG [Clostridia bacterium]